MMVALYCIHHSERGEIKQSQINMHLSIPLYQSTHTHMDPQHYVHTAHKHTWTFTKADINKATWTHAQTVKRPISSTWSSWSKTSTDTKRNLTWCRAKVGPSRRSSPCHSPLWAAVSVCVRDHSTGSVLRPWCAERGWNRRAEPIT